MAQIVTPVEVAELLRIHVRTVYKLAAEGAIPGSRIGRSWRFDKSAILALLSGKNRRGPEKAPRKSPKN